MGSIEGDWLDELGFESLVIVCDGDISSRFSLISPPESFFMQIIVKFKIIALLTTSEREMVLNPRIMYRVLLENVNACFEDGPPEPEAAEILESSIFCKIWYCISYWEKWI